MDQPEIRHKAALDAGCMGIMLNSASVFGEYTSTPVQVEAKHITPAHRYRLWQVPQTSTLVQVGAKYITPVHRYSF